MWLKGGRRIQPLFILITLLVAGSHSKHFRVLRKEKNYIDLRQNSFVLSFNVPNCLQKKSMFRRTN